MAIGKWSMYICAVLFLIIGLGALAVAVVPGVDDWVAEQTLDASGLSSDSPIRDEAVDAITDDGMYAGRCPAPRAGRKTLSWRCLLNAISVLAYCRMAPAER